MTPEARGGYSGSWADVRDNAEVHGKLFSAGGVAGERVIVVAGTPHRLIIYQWTLILTGWRYL